MQKRACGGASAPQSAQTRASGLPQPMQNRAPSGFCCEHPEQAGMSLRNSD
jgi:hypothetical protein